MGLKRYCFLFLGFLILFTSCDFLGIGGDDGDDEPEPQPQPELAWELGNLGNLDSPPPLIEDNSVFVTNLFSIARLTLAEGETEWVTELPGVSPAVFGKILSDEDNIYLRLEQSVEAFNKADGTQIWSATFEDSLTEGQLAPGTSLLDQSNSHIFVGTREKLLIINKQQGTIEQTITPDIPVGVMPSRTYNVPVAAQSTNSELVFLFSSFQQQNSAEVNGRITAYNIVTGSLVWDQAVPFQLPAVGTIQSPSLQVTLVNNRLFLMTGPAIVAFDAQSGEQVSTNLFVEDRTDIEIGRLLVDQANSLYAVAGNQILELDRATGSRIREFPIETSGIIDRLVITDNNLYYSTSIGVSSTTILAVDIENGERQFRLTSNSGLIDGLTPAFSVADSFLVDIGVTGIFGYNLPE